ncbi:hypothetical protein J3L12_01545 [Meiothermus sp. CFH 77666]|nr:hypothetical protein [Meiothermus sp. CFH 77666]
MWEFYYPMMGLVLEKHDSHRREPWYGTLWHEFKFWWRPGEWMVREETNKEIQNQRVTRESGKRVIARGGQKKTMWYNKTRVEPLAKTVRCSNGFGEYLCDPINNEAFELGTLPREHFLLLFLLFTHRFGSPTEDLFLNRPVISVEATPIPEETLSSDTVWAPSLGEDELWHIGDLYRLKLDLETGLLLHLEAFAEGQVFLRAEVRELALGKLPPPPFLVSEFE